MGGRTVFITGGTGYIGSRLVPLLIERQHSVRALAREGSESKLPPSCTLIPGNALDSSTFVEQIFPSDTFIHLVGVSHPSPSKAQEFQRIDLGSMRASVAAASKTEIKHFVYVSVAQPAPVMKAYLSARAEAEAILKQSGLNATILRPWYVLGPGHRWPYLLGPIYWVLSRVPKTKDSAQRLGLVKLTQMLSALVHCVENPTTGIRMLEVPQIRKF